MKKYRIVQICHDSYSDNRKIEYYIQGKRYGFWRTINKIEGPKTKSITFLTYTLAEEYLFRNYTGHGECIKIGDIYYYRPYSYSSC